MTAANLPPKIEYIENALTLTHPVPFRFKAPEHIKAQRFFADGTVTDLVYGTDYSVTGGATDAGGTLTKASAGIAGTILKIQRETPRSQDMDYATADTFPSESHEGVADKAMLIAQEQDINLAETAARSVQVAEGKTAPTLDLDGLTDGDLLEYHAGTLRRKLLDPLKYLATDALGKVISVAGAISTVAALAANISIDGGGTVQEALDSRAYAFASIATRTVPANIDRITIKDRGSMIMKRSASDPGALWPAGYMKVQDASGAWWIFDTEAQQPCAQHFNVEMEPWGTYGGTDQTAKLQAFSSFIANVPCWRGANMACEAAMTQLDMKPASGEWATKNLWGVMRLRGIAYVTGRYSIEIDDTPNYFHWDGGIVHSAFGASGFADRGNWGGICVGNSSRGEIAELHSSYNIAHGVRIARASGDNANLLKVGRVGGNFNGCGWDFPTTTFSQTIPAAFTQYGGDTSTDQRTRIGGFTLAQLPHPAFDQYVADLGAVPNTGSTQRTDSMLAVVGSYGVRKVTYVDRVNGAIGLFPKVPAAAAGQTIKYICGGAAAFEGADANILQIDVVEGSINGTGIDYNGFYNGVISQFHTDGVGVAITGGSRNTAGTRGGVITLAYIEAASFADLAPQSGGWDLRVLQMTSGYDYPVIANLLDPVSDATGARTRGAAAIGACEVTIKGVTFKNNRNIARYGNAVTLALGGDNPQKIHTSGNATITLAPSMPTFVNCIEQMGARHMSIIVQGDGANYAPGGTVTIAAIAGFKFNGGAVNTALALGTPTKPTRIDFWFNEEDSQNIIVTTQPFA